MKFHLLRSCFQISIVAVLIFSKCEAAQVSGRGDFEHAWQNCLSKEIIHVLSETKFRKLKVKTTGWNPWSGYYFGMESPDGEKYHGSIFLQVIDLPKWENHEVVYGGTYCYFYNESMGVSDKAFELYNEKGVLVEYEFANHGHIIHGAGKIEVVESKYSR